MGYDKKHKAARDIVAAEYDMATAFVAEEEAAHRKTIAEAMAAEDRAFNSRSEVRYEDARAARIEAEAEYKAWTSEPF